MAEGINYKKAGVDIEAGDQAVESIKNLAGLTFRPEVLQGIGGFGGLFAPNLSNANEPVLVAGCDGVGTKLKLAFAVDRHDTIGIDCVAMCVNDILVQGAEPLFFLDYLAVGKMDPLLVESIVSGLVSGCRESGCALLGGETAEMPGFYPPGEYDLAGFAVGMVSRGSLVDGSAIKKGDLIIGLASSGMHSNGFSLARRILLEEATLKLTDYQSAFESTLSDELLKPTTIYVRPVLSLLKNCPVKGMAHITGGGLVGNLPRILPAGLAAEIDITSWPGQKIFEVIADLGSISRAEMYNVFNMGIGFVLVVPETEAAGIIRHFTEFQLQAYSIGRITAGEREVILK
jgi:phosphoribosylformylglycinamidine cyclo-ligase